MIPTSAVGPIHRLAWATTEDEAMALIAEAVLRGANPDEAREAFRLWEQLQESSVVRLYTSDAMRSA